jgi:type II secretory pathway pseudopilin PulG
MRSRLSNEGGFVLPMVLIVMALVLGIGSIMLLQMRGALDTNRQYRDFQACDLAAKNAMEECQAALAADPGYTGTSGYVQDNGASYRITVTVSGENKRAVVIDSTFGRYEKHYSGEAWLDAASGKLTHFSMKLIQ